MNHERAMLKREMALLRCQADSDQFEMATGKT